MLVLKFKQSEQIKITHNGESIIIRPEFDDRGKPTPKVAFDGDLGFQIAREERTQGGLIDVRG